MPASFGSMNGAHVVGRLDVRADIANVDLAHALRPRIEALGWQLMPRVLERVFDALVPEGVYLRLRRLDLDLGRIRPAHLEEDALRALEAALSDALIHAIGEARQTPSDDARLVDAPERVLGRFEAYLATGIMPFTGEAVPFDALTSLRELAAEQPVMLVAMLRRRAGDRHFLERLVLQAGEAGIRDLLAVLAPADAETILAILGDIVAVHVSEAFEVLRPLTEAGLNRLLLVTTLEFLLRDAGSQFNRRRFLDFLLSREAMRAGVGYNDLLDLLSAAVQRASARFGLRSSLPRVLTELLAERRGAPELGVVPEWRRGGPAAAGVLAPAAFAAIVGLMEPGEAAGILSDVDLLVRVYDGALTGTGPAGWRSRVHALVLEALTEAGQRPADRRTVWLHVLAGLSRNAGIGMDMDPEAFVGWADLVAPRGESGSGLEALARWVGPEVFAGLVRRMRPVDAERILADLSGLAEQHERLAPAMGDARAFAASLRGVALRYLVRIGGGGRFDRRGFWRHLLAGMTRHQAVEADHGGARAPWRPGRLGTLAGSLPRGESEALEALAHTLGRDGVAEVIGWLAPDDAPAVLRDLGRLIARMAGGWPGAPAVQGKELAPTAFGGWVPPAAPGGPIVQALGGRSVVPAAGQSPDPQAQAEAAPLAADGKTIVSSRRGGPALPVAPDGHVLPTASGKRSAQAAFEGWAGPADPAGPVVPAEGGGPIALPAGGESIVPSGRGEARGPPVRGELVMPSAGGEPVVQAVVGKPAVAAMGGETGGPTPGGLVVVPGVDMGHTAGDPGAFAAMVGGLTLDHLLTAENAPIDRRKLRRYLRDRIAKRAVGGGAGDRRGDDLSRHIADEMEGAVTAEATAFTFDDLVSRLAPRDAPAVLAILNDLAAEFAAEAPSSVEDATVRHAIEARLLQVLAGTRDTAPPPGGGSSDEPSFDPVAIKSRLRAALGRPDGSTWAGSSVETLDPLSTGTHHDAAGTKHEDRIVSFLRTGRPSHGGHELDVIAASDPAWLATTLRAMVRELPESATELAERVLLWLLPEELLTLLAPRGAGTFSSRLVGLPGGDHTVWYPVVTALLRGAEPEVLPDTPSLGARLDWLARIDHWLSLGTLAERVAGPVPLAQLAELTLAELSSLLLADSPEQTGARVGRAIGGLDPAGQIRLLTQLAPWATNSKGAFGSILARFDPSSRQDVLMRVAAAAVAGTKIDLAAVNPPNGARLADGPGGPPPGVVLDMPAVTGRLDAPAVAAVAAAALAGTGADLAAPAGPGDAGDVPADLDSARPRDSLLVDRAALFAWLDGAPVDAAQATRLAGAFAALADADDAALIAYVAANRGRPRARARWAEVLPRAALGRLVQMLVPESARALLDGAMLIATSWRQVAPFGARRPAESEFNALLLDQIAIPGPIDIVAVIATLVRNLTHGDPAQSGKLQARGLRLAQDGGYVSVAAALRRAPRLAARRAQRPAVPARRPEPRDTPPPEPAHAMFVRNAGLVLLNPYLPVLFERLGVLTRDEAGTPRIEGLEAVSRAVHLLQYLADGRLDRPEPELVLNKLLCGQTTAQLVSRSIEPVQADLDICDDLLRAVIANWPVLSNTSPDGLRETFLQREGRLQRRDANWTLQVQRKTLDVLTDQIPWSFAVVYHRWMSGPIHVTW